MRNIKNCKKISYFFLFPQKIPKNILGVIKKLCIYLLWNGKKHGRRIALVSWNNLLLLKSLGCWGLHNMERFGLALAVKSCWSMFSHNSLWSLVMRVKYLKSLSVVGWLKQEPKVTRGGSVIWRNSVSGVQALEKWILWNV